MAASSGQVLTQLREFFWGDPLLGVAITAAVVALATTPIAFAVLGRSQWFRARRGRTMQRPEFWSVVCSMILVMGIPAIFLLLAIKSRYYDRSRYEFDPNLTISVLDQGRQYRTLREADEAVRAERKRLEFERKNLVDQVKQLDEAMLVLRATAPQAPAAVPAIKGALERIAALHRSIGLDAPQQLMEELGTPEALAGLSPAGPSATAPTMAASVPAPAAPAAPPGAGLSPAERTAALATVPAPQRPLAEMLPLSGLPEGWEVGELGGKRLETFNAENLYEKINGRAESFIQYGVTGMACAFFHPVGDETLEAYLYIYQMGDALKAFGKYSSEKREDVEALAVGEEGYVSSGSAFFYAGPYYVTVETTSEDPRVAAFVKMLAARVAEAIKPGSAPKEMLAMAAPGAASTAPAAEPATPAPASTGAESEAAVATSPTQLFKLLPAGPKRSGEKYVAQDVFGYSFLSDVFLADYQEGDVYWQGFLRPYASPEEAGKVFDQYVAAVKEFGAQVKELEGAEADRMVSSNLDGLVDVFFLKGNAIAGANGSTEAASAESFARAYAKQLPGKVPAIASSPAAAPVATEPSDGEE